MPKQKSLQSLGKEMGNAFATAKQEFDDRNSPLPDGDYVARITSCCVKDSKSSDIQYVEVAYYIMEGEQAKRTEYDRMVIIPERAFSIINFFEKFDFDTAPLSGDNCLEVLEEFCTLIHQATPLVRLKAKYWEKQETGSSGVNLRILKILEFNEDPSGQDYAAVQEASEEDDGLDNLDKKDLKKIIDEEDLDISMKTFSKGSKEEVIELIRKCRIEEAGQVLSSNTDNSNENDNLELRERLYALCEGQGIIEAESAFDFDSLTYEEMREVIENTETGEAYRFDIDGDDAITEEEKETLVMCGFDHLINAPKLPKKVPPKRAASAKKGDHK